MNTRWLIWFCLMGSGGLSAAEPPVGRTGAVACDPTKVIGPETCTKCHGQELAIWRQTAHFLHLQRVAAEAGSRGIAQRMGLRSIKRGDLCIQCHYTLQKKGARDKAIAGVSCESCHGAAADWIAVHNDYGGPTATKESETAEHRAQRLKQSMEHGMRNPANLYLIARSCCSCHMVSHEALVNVGGHNAGSDEFELVSWSQGSLRHNFQSSGGLANQPSSRERLRAMYVVGLITKLEYSLRSTSAATEVATVWLCQRRKSVPGPRAQLADVQDKVGVELLDRILETAYGVKLKTNNAEELQRGGRSNQPIGA